MSSLKQDKLTAKDLLTLLGNSPELTPVQVSEEHPILYFIKESDTAKMIVLPPSTDNNALGSDDCPSFEEVLKELQNWGAINKADCLIFPLLQQHAYQYNIILKTKRNQWVTFVVRFDENEGKWVGTLIDPGMQIQTSQYQGNDSFEKVFSEVFSPSMMVKMNLNKKKSSFHVKASASGHWTMHCIQLLLKGTKLADLTEIMSRKKAKDIIEDNKKLYETPCQRPRDIGLRNLPPAILAMDERERSLIKSPTRSPYSGRSYLDIIRSRSSSLDSEISYENNTQSQFDIMNNNRQNSKNLSASLCLNCYALLFMGGAVVAALGVICLLQAQLAVLPIVSTGLIGAGVFGMFVGTVGMCARQSPFYEDPTLVNAPN